MGNEWSLIDLNNGATGVDFGAVVRDVEAAGYAPGEKVSAVFQSACPRNNLRTEGTFLTVERLSEDGTWDVVRLIPTCSMTEETVIGTYAVKASSTWRILALHHGMLGRVWGD